VPKVKFDIAEIAEEFMAAYGGWYERMQIAKVEARMAAESAANQARYVEAGRRLQKMTTAALKRRWVNVYRRDLEASRRRREELDDLGAELALRNMTKVDMPADVRELMVAEATLIAGAAG
jgi:hypothetical protein